MTELTAPIVGMHFRPPAKEVVNLLPPNTRVLLRREPTNEYDEFAVQVLLPGFNELNEGPAGDIYKQIAESGAYGEDLLVDHDPLHLAFVDSKKTGMAKMFSQAMLFEERSYQTAGDHPNLADLPDKLLLFEAKLTFDLAGKPQVVTELQVSSEQYEKASGELEVEDGDNDDDESDSTDDAAREDHRNMHFPPRDDTGTQ